MLKNTFRSLLIAATLYACNTNQSPSDSKKEDTHPLKLSAADSMTTYSSAQFSFNEVGKSKLYQKRQKVKFINNNKKAWNKKREEEDSDAYKEYKKTFYYKNDTLVKLDVVTYQVSGQQKDEFYFDGGQLLFTYENIVTYNRPIHYDSAEMKKNSDSVIFDPNKSEVNEIMSYFENDTLIHQVNSKGSTPTIIDDYLLKEQTRIHSKLEVVNRYFDFAQ